MPSAKQLLTALAVAVASAALLGQGACSEAPPRPPPQKELSGVSPEYEEGSAEEDEGHPSRSRPRPKRQNRLRSLRVTEVIDGDTVETDKLGRVRLIGVDTPERRDCYDDAATRFTEFGIGGKRVRYEVGEEREDRYGRTLAYLYRGGMHNLALVSEGYTRVLTIPPNDKYESRFEAAERRPHRGPGRVRVPVSPTPGSRTAPVLLSVKAALHDRLRMNSTARREKSSTPRR